MEACDQPARQHTEAIRLGSHREIVVEERRPHELGRRVVCARIARRTARQQTRLGRKTEQTGMDRRHEEQQGWWQQPD